MKKIAVIGLGYVGLPVAVGFGKKTPVIGFDINAKRIDELKSGHDRNLETSKEEFTQAQIEYTSNVSDLSKANFYIVSVPTPVSSDNRPDMSIVLSATKTVGSVLKSGDIVVYESTVYPGATEEECAPLLEEISGLKLNKDFFIGFSPERINPGDREHTLEKIVKVVSGSTPEVLDEIADMYAQVVTAGVFRASSIKVAEAAKVIENTQRDINIAFMNELSIIFSKLGINTQDVLDAAKTKWNFLNFYPGLVGGHCVGVDPYYLTHKAESVGYHPQVILSGRRINDGMGKWIAGETIKGLVKAGHRIADSTITILGLTFKENTPDIRNTRIIDIVRELQDFGVKVQIHDPLASNDEVKHEYGIELTSYEKLEPAAALIMGVKHREFENLTAENIRELLKDKNSLVVNIQSHIKKEQWAALNINHWYL